SDTLEGVNAAYPVPVASGATRPTVWLGPDAVRAWDVLARHQLYAAGRAGRRPRRRPRARRQLRGAAAPTAPVAVRAARLSRRLGRPGAGGAGVAARGGAAA